MSNLVSTFTNPVWRRLKQVVSGSSTETVDTIPLANFRCLKYIIALSNTTESKYRYLELTISRAGSSVEDSIFSKLGDKLDIDANVSISGSDAILEIVNSETFDLTVDMRRLIIR